jgi:hypothetical protein
MPIFDLHAQEAASTLAGYTDLYDMITPTYECDFNRISRFASPMHHCLSDRTRHVFATALAGHLTVANGYAAR